MEQLTSSNHTSTALLQVTQSDTVQKLNRSDFKSLSALMPRTVKEAVELGNPLSMVLKVTKAETVIQFIQFELVKLASLLNVNPNLNLQDHQIPVIADTIFHQFPNESLEDFSLAFRKGVLGMYGEIFRLDGAVIIRWIQLYLDEKYSYIEEQNTKQKREEGDPINYKLFLERLTEERAKQNDNRQEEIDRRRKQAVGIMNGEPVHYKPDPERVKEFEKHQEWIKENYNTDGTRK